MEVSHCKRKRVGESVKKVVTSIQLISDKNLRLGLSKASNRHASQTNAPKQMPCNECISTFVALLVCIVFLILRHD